MGCCTTVCRAYDHIIGYSLGSRIPTLETVVGILKWIGREVEGPKVEESQEVKYCAVCECELHVNGSRWVRSPWEECIEVCEACFETKPENYKEVEAS